jgi:hypothetical protein
MAQSIEENKGECYCCYCCDCYDCEREDLFLDNERDFNDRDFNDRDLNDRDERRERERVDDFDYDCDYKIYERVWVR